MQSEFSDPDFARRMMAGLAAKEAAETAAREGDEADAEQPAPAQPTV